MFTNLHGLKSFVVIRVMRVCEASLLAEMAGARQDFFYFFHSLLVFDRVRGGPAYRVNSEVAMAEHICRGSRWLRAAGATKLERLDTARRLQRRFRRAQR